MPEKTNSINNLSELQAYLTNNRYFISQNIIRRNLFARSAVFYPFTLEGIFMGVWSSYLPNIQDSLNLTDSQLGVAVLSVYLATVLATPLSAVCIRKFGSKYATLLGKVTFGLSLPTIALAGSFGVLVPAMFAYGFTMGIMDVCMNSCAILTEIVAGIPLMGSFHGSYSVAAAIGSLLGGAFVEAKYPTLNVFMVLSACATFLACVSSFNMYSFSQEAVINAYNDEQDRLDLIEQIHEGAIRVTSMDNRIASKDHEHNHVYHSLQSDENIKQFHKINDVEAPLLGGDEEEASSNAARIGINRSHAQHNLDQQMVGGSTNSTTDGNKGTTPSGANASDDELVAGNAKHSLMFFCMVGFLSAFGESGIVTWSTVFFERYLQTTSVTRSLGFTCFMVSMAIGRFCCDYLRRVFGRQLIVRTGGLLACGGVLLVVMSLSLPASLVFACLGFALAGIGLSTLIPIMFSSAGHLPGTPADTSIAMTAGCSYSGSIISSPLIGFLSDSFDSLRYAMLAFSLIIGLIFIFGIGIPPEYGVLATKSQRAHSHAADDAIMSNNSGIFGAAAENISEKKST